MKFNWGTGIFIFYSFFVLFILTLVFRSTQEPVDLVTEDYYQQELVFQEVIKKKANAERLDVGLKYTLDKMNIYFTFPPSHKNATGTILIYRASNKNYDKKVEIDLDDQQSMGVALISSPGGLYKMKVDWNSDSVGYYIEEDIYLKP